MAACDPVRSSGRQVVWVRLSRERLRSQQHLPPRRSQSDRADTEGGHGCPAGRPFRRRDLRVMTDLPRANDALMMCLWQIIRFKGITSKNTPGTQPCPPNITTGLGRLSGPDPLRQSQREYHGSCSSCTQTRSRSASSNRTKRRPWPNRSTLLLISAWRQSPSPLSASRTLEPARRSRVPARRSSIRRIPAIKFIVYRQVRIDRRLVPPRRTWQSTLKPNYCGNQSAFVYFPMTTPIYIQCIDVGMVAINESMHTAIFRCPVPQEASPVP